MKFLAFDTETTLIEDRASLLASSGSSPGHDKRTGKVFTSPWKTPTLILGSVAGEQLAPAVMAPADLAGVLLLALHNPECHLVGHNIGFDIDVCTKAFPDLGPLFETAMEEGRLHDTKLLDQLYGLAIGRYDRPRYHPEAMAKEPKDRWWSDDLVTRSLEAIAHEYCGITLNKDPRIRLGYAQFAGKPICEIPEEFVAYALQDAKATLRVFQELKRRLDGLGAKNWLSEPLQLKADHVCRDMDKRGVRIDRKLATDLWHRFAALLGPLEEKLVAAGLGRWEPKPKTRFTTTLIPAELASMTGDGWMRSGGSIYQRKVLKSGVKWTIASPEFHINTAAIQEAIAASCNMENAPRRADGTVSMEYDHWVSRVPPSAPALATWLERTKIEKILSTYLNVYSKADRIFPKWWVLGARSNRMSASCPSVQNVPKRKLGIRALFLPDEGKLFTKSDYSAQEMFTLAESMLNMGIRGPLYEALTSGKDMHYYAASLILGRPIAQITKDERQATKVLNFGVPGGLGAESLSEYAHALYGISWTPKEAGAQRDRYLEVFDDVNAYLLSMKRSQDTLLRKVTGLGRKDWAEALELNDWNVIRAMSTHANPEIAEVGLECERQLTIELPTGFRRGNCRFTEGANCHFQGLAAGVTKEAMFRAYRLGLEISLVVHDEIVIQSKPEDVDTHAKLLEKAMLGAFVQVCPNLGPYAKVEVTKGLTRWGPATGPDGKALVV